MVIFAILQAKKRLFWEIQRETEHGMLLGGPEILRKIFHTIRKRSTEKMVPGILGSARQLLIVNAPAGRQNTKQINNKHG